MEHVGPLAPTGPPQQAKLPDVDEVGLLSFQARDSGTEDAHTKVRVYPVV